MIARTPTYEPVIVASTKEEEGLTHEPWDDHKWSQCSKCQKWYRSELTEGSCSNCTNLPEPII